MCHDAVAVIYSRGDGGMGLQQETAVCWVEKAVSDLFDVVLEGEVAGV